MAKELPGRTDIQCRHHFQNLEACANNPWTKEEDRLLEILVARRGTDLRAWTLVSEGLAAQFGKKRGATKWPTICRERYYALHPQVKIEREPKKRVNMSSAL